MGSPGELGAAFGLCTSFAKEGEALALGAAGSGACTGVTIMADGSDRGGGSGAGVPTMGWTLSSGDGGDAVTGTEADEGARSVASVVRRDRTNPAAAIAAMAMMPNPNARPRLEGCAVPGLFEVLEAGFIVPDVTAEGD